MVVVAGGQPVNPAEPARAAGRAKRAGASRRRRPVTTIGWREWVALPDFGVPAVKVKVDTGARTSALHAFRLRTGTVDGVPVARFEIHPHQRNAADAVRVESPIVAWRRVRSSNGEIQDRPVIRTVISLGGVRWPIEVTLTNRDEMGFRMLLGRSAVRRRFVVDPGRSFLVSRRDGTLEPSEPSASNGAGPGHDRPPTTDPCEANTP